METHLVAPWFTQHVDVHFQDLCPSISTILLSKSFHFATLPYRSFYCTFTIPFFIKLNSFPPNQRALTMFYRDSLKRLTVQESTNALVLLPRGRSSPYRLIINQTCWCHEEKSATLLSFKERVNEPSSLVLDALLAINSGRESGVQPEALEWTSVLFPFLYMMVVSVNSTRIRRSNRRGWCLWTF